MTVLPELVDSFEPTRATLHAYALVIGAVPRLHAVPQPHWWHSALHLEPGGLATVAVDAPGGRLTLLLDLIDHEVVASVGDGVVTRIDMTAGMSATELSDRLFAAIAGLGLEDRYDRSRFADDEPRHYRPEAAAAYRDAFTGAAAMLGDHRLWLAERIEPERIGSVHVWPHHFDMSLEWYGTHHVVSDGTDYPVQLNLGFDPLAAPYFYSNPWPFDPSLVGAPLPHGASWHTAGWEGTMLSYEAVRRGGAAVFAEYARAVFDLAAPTLA